MHEPVMVDEILKAFTEVPRPVKKYFDGTFGRGGHCRKLLEVFPDLRIVAVDCDGDAIHYGQQILAEQVERGQVKFIRSFFSDFKEFGEKDFDIMLLDLGVSSPQLDEAQRGFSVYHDGPLDMRMDDRLELTAADIINSWDEKEMAQLFIDLGEVRHPYRVANFIARERENESIRTTKNLAQIIEKAEGWRKRGVHPATKYFMALRIKVNAELTRLEESLSELVDGLALGGRLSVITFHSLEDRIVKQVFRRLSQTKGILVNKKVIRPTESEIEKNPRARSAKLRIFQRGSDNES